MDKILMIAAIVLGFTLILCMIRVVVGPTAGDRVIAINVIGTKTVALLAIVAGLMHETYFLDVALVYCIISFAASFFIAREFSEGRDSGCKS